ncbi:hypothetical protein HUU51_04020 [Candidatus Gracilibacteria bacterium]|nr:hypothetical protein [Candidatus Gracilibacteria bacterium]
MKNINVNIMRKQEIIDYGKDEITEVVMFAINDVLTLSKEIEWPLVLLEKDDSKSVTININGKPFIFSELSNYFYEKEFLDVPVKYLFLLYKLLLELRVLGEKINNLSENDKISILDFVTNMISSREKQIGNDFCFPQNYKDMIMMELGLDIVDKVGDAKNETLALLEVIMLKR